MLKHQLFYNAAIFLFKNYFSNKFLVNSTPKQAKWTFNYDNIKNTVGCIIHS